MASKLDIINQALVRLGESTITDLNTPLGEVVETVFDTVKETLLTSHRWRFAVQKSPLSQAAGTPENQWNKHFTLPTDMLMLITTYPTSNYELYGNKLLTNASSVEIDYIYDPGEKKYPAYFVTALAKTLAAEVCLSITRDKSLYELIKMEALDDLAGAKSKDSQGRPPTAIVQRPFIDIRR